MKYRSNDCKLLDLDDAVCIEATNHEEADPLIEWCGGERAGRPGYLIALKSWANIWMLGKTGDWIAHETGGYFRIWTAGEFARNYTPA